MSICPHRMLATPDASLNLDRLLYTLENTLFQTISPTALRKFSSLFSKYILLKQTRSLLNLFNLPLQVFDHENNKTVDVREIGTIIRSLGHCPSVSQLQVGENQSKRAA
jgi:hypothetical protein